MRKKEMKKRGKYNLAPYKKEINPEELVWLCIKCGKHCKTRKLRYAHESYCGKERGQKPKRKPKPTKNFDCNICGKTFKSSSSLETHMCKEHGVPIRHICDQQNCTFKSNNRSKFLSHVYSVHNLNLADKRIFRCSYCEFSTIMMEALTRHEMSHTITEYSLNCTNEGCDKKFRTRKHLKRHLEICNVDLKLKCRYCVTICATQEKLKRHERDTNCSRMK